MNPHPKKSVFQGKSRTLLIFSTILALACALLCCGYVIHGRIHAAVDDFYCGLAADSMLVEYLKANEGKWPRSWEDIHSWQERDSNIPEERYDIQYFHDRLDIDFTADPQELEAAAKRTDGSFFPVVMRYRRGGAAARCDSLLNYFRSRSKKSRDICNNQPQSPPGRLQPPPDDNRVVPFIARPKSSADAPLQRWLRGWEDSDLSPLSAWRSKGQFEI